MISEDRFLAFAKRILSQSQIPEEECRTAISRAYYSLYHITGAILKKKYSFQLIEGIKKSSHRKKIHLARLNSLDRKYLSSFNLHQAFFLTLFDLGFKTMAFQFKDFRSKRNAADYDLDLSFEKTFSTIIVEEIDKLATEIRNL